MVYQNRRLFLDRLQQLFERAQRTPNRQYAVLFVDLDSFKIFNDTMGPAVGAQVIVEIGRRIEVGLRDEDTVSRSQNQIARRNAVLSRMGGDEFTILLEDEADPSDAMRVAKRILSVVAGPFLVEGREVRTSASVGIAVSAPTRTPGPKICCRTPTLPCAAPKLWEGLAAKCLTRRCTLAP